MIQHPWWIRVILGTTLVLVPCLAPEVAQTQSYEVLHNFTGAADGGNPFTGLTMDKGGSLYGTTAPSFAGGTGYGGVFRLKRVGSGWVFSPLYSFAGGSDGAEPVSPVEFGPDGTLYGTTNQGAEGGCYGGKGCGTVFRLQPAATACKTALCPWSETVLYRFTGGGDGGNPNGPLVFDQSGDIYGTARRGGQGVCEGYGCGTVYELTHSGNNWTQSVLYSFTGGSDEGLPDSGVIFDPSGNLYGTTQGCVGDNGTAFELTPAGLGWDYSTIFTFGGSAGYCPVAGLILDSMGNLYGATALSAAAFELTFSNGNWILSRFLSLGSGGGDCGPQDALVMDSTGNLYGTTYCGGANGLGSVFKLTPSSGGWTYTDLHDFGGSDGAYPSCSLVLDSSGNLYGTASQGGTGSACTGGCGVIFEITP